ncbi:ABC transporter permease [Clostridium estertheticum]|uniref:ABC transporter permease n=1 Tax=Clostridium estertheticum TaxID=238834 RepID=UPI001C7D4D60|nr:ABC transporter permease [Clostridium estertheticum]MBX4259593.1 ABC transporter permease [Clostridium estertheticum]WLC70580.1 ABC transporter permease [Clostridium estertheticum]
MNILESLKMAIASILSNKMRSFLTMLGIIIGISSVITIVALGNGGKNYIGDEFAKMGSNTVTLNVDPSKVEQISDYFTLDDVKQIKNRVDTAKYISPTVSKKGTARTETKTSTANVTGVNTDYSLISNVEIVYGRFLNEREVEEGKAVAVIDQTSAKALFGTDDAVGKSFKLGPVASSKSATVVGVSKASSMFGGSSGPRSRSGDSTPTLVTVPITFLETLFPLDFNISTLTMTSTSQANSVQTGNEALKILQAKHDNKTLDLYKATNSASMLESINQVLGIFTAFLSAVAAISLLVGGIGVMNIMLVSVTERTKEIGIRKAIGATTNAILFQFLTESVILSLIGGLIGMTLGIVAAKIIGSFAGITPSVSILVILETILFSSVVGIFFGIYPARKAAKLNPIDALRYE